MQDSGKIQAPPLIQFLAPDDNKQAPCLHKLCYFADLNGDGILEIIAGERQGKSLRYAVYTSQGENVVRVPEKRSENCQQFDNILSSVADPERNEISVQFYQSFTWHRFIWAMPGFFGQWNLPPANDRGIFSPISAQSRQKHLSPLVSR